MNEALLTNLISNFFVTTSKLNKFVEMFKMTHFYDVIANEILQT